MKSLTKLREAWSDLRRGPGTLAERVERNADVLIVVVMILAFILRLAFLTAFHGELRTRREKGFWFPAWNLAHGDGMGIAADCPDSYRAPLYILFVTPFFAIFDEDYVWPLGLAQMAVALANVFLVYVLGKEWRSKRVGLLGAFFMAIYPYNLYHDTQFYISFLFTFFLLLTFIGMLRLERAPTRHQAYLNGLWIGLAMLATSGPMVFFAPLACAWLWKRWGSFKKALVSSAIMAAAALLIMTPWIIRNYAVHHRFVPLTTDAGRVFYKAYNSYALGMMFEGLWVDATPEPVGGGPQAPMGGIHKVSCDYMGGVSEVDSSRFYGDIAKRWVAEHPATTAGLMSLKAVYLWRPWMFPPKGVVGGNGSTIISAAAMNWAYALSYGFLLTFAALEWLLASREERKRTWLFLLAAIAFTLTYVITVAGTKYRIPLDSIMAVMAAAGVWRFASAFLAWKANRKK